MYWHPFPPFPWGIFQPKLFRQILVAEYVFLEEALKKIFETRAWISSGLVTMLLSDDVFCFSKSIFVLNLMTWSVKKTVFLVLWYSTTRTVVVTQISTEEACKNYRKMFLLFFHHVRRRVTPFKCLKRSPSTNRRTGLYVVRACAAHDWDREYFKNAIPKKWRTKKRCSVLTAKAPK